MKKLKLYCYISFLLGIILTFCFLLENINAEQNPPPPGGGDSNGDWIIEDGDNILRENQEIKLRGNLIIEEGGILTFKNVTLKMNCSVDGEFGIEVQSGGEFYIFDNDDNKKSTGDRSNITSYYDEYEYHFLVYENAKFEMKLSELSNCGYMWGNEHKHTGLWINTNNSIIEGNHFYDNPEVAINCYESSPIIKNNIFSNNHAGVHSSYGNPTIFNNEFINNELAIFCMGLVPILSNNEILNNDIGIDCLWSDPKIDNITISKCNTGIGLRNSTPKLIDSKISVCETDFHFIENSNMTCINATFDKMNVKFDDEDSVLIVCWRLSILILDKNEKPVKGAIVKLITNKDETFENPSDSNGYVKTDNCLEYALMKNGEVYFSPYRITAEKDGLKNKITVEITKNTDVIIKLTEKGDDEDGGICIVGFIISIIVIGSILIIYRRK